VAIRILSPSRVAGAAAAIESSRVGAAFRWVIASPSIAAQMSAGSVVRRQTWVPPAAVTAQVKHQPLQWNIGSVHRYLVPGPRRAWYAMAVACRYAPRWWYITPLGRPVVPLV